MPSHAQFRVAILSVAAPGFAGPFNSCCFSYADNDPGFRSLRVEPREAFDRQTLTGPVPITERKRFPFNPCGVRCVPSIRYCLDYCQIGLSIERQHGFTTLIGPRRKQSDTFSEGFKTSLSQADQRARGAFAYDASACGLRFEHEFNAAREVMTVNVRQTNSAADTGVSSARSTLLPLRCRCRPRC